MAKQTPEGKVKAELLQFLKSLGDKCFYYMPVQNGMGQSGIPDVMCIYGSIPFAFECKATPKQRPTTLQAMQLERIHKAGGVAWVVDNESLSLAKTIISSIDFSGIISLDIIQSLADEPEAKALYRWNEKLEVMEFGNGSCS